jgi:hypothetical protein
MRLLPAVCIALALPLTLCNAATAALRKPLTGQIEALAKDLRDVLTADPKLKGQTVTIGVFSGPQLPRTNFGQKLRRLLQEKLKDLLREEGAGLTITGRYDYVESETDAPQEDHDTKLQVIRITASIEDKAAREQAKKFVEVNETDDIVEALGLTVAPDLHGGQKARNDAAKKAQEKPTFVVRGRTQVAAAADSPFAVEILVKDKVAAPATLIAPQNQKGQAFADVKPEQFYEIRLHNDADFEAAATVTIDGLDALNTFNKDGRKYSHYLIPARGAVTVRGWLQTVKPGVKDNVLSFLVTEYGHGAATALKSTGEIGVITVGFHAAWKEGDPLPPGESGTRSVGRETRPGPGLPENLEVVKRNIGLKRATVSVRYSPTTP